MSGDIDRPWRPGPGLARRLRADLAEPAGRGRAGEALRPPGVQPHARGARRHPEVRLERGDAPWTRRRIASPSRRRTTSTWRRPRGWRRRSSPSLIGWRPRCPISMTRCSPASLEPGRVERLSSIQSLRKKLGADYPVAREPVSQGERPAPRSDPLVDDGVAAAPPADAAGLGTSASGLVDHAAWRERRMPTS